MCTMCHLCGADLKRLKEDNKKLEYGNSLKLSNGGLIRSCKFCGEKQGRQDVKLDGLSPYATPMISPTTSLASSDSYVSSCSDFSVDVNSYDRQSHEESMVEGSQENINSRLNGRIGKLSSENQLNRTDRSNAKTDSNSRPCNGGDGRCTVRDIEIQSSDGQEMKDNAVKNTMGSLSEETEASCGLDGDMDTQIWEPPEPDDPKDDVEGSVAYNDDDDECGDGTKWGEPSQFSDEGSASYKFKLEKQQAMEDVINGRFKTVVSQLLSSMGVSPSEDNGESWVDIVTSLSWEAASFLKPDTVDGKAMDPDGYVKVKCIAAGSRSESQLIKGLVFKKHAAHKHMPTKYKNPRLLLIKGVLGHSSSGLSSFHSMEEEKGHLKSLSDMLDFCHPNVVLVEKTVSRDVQESILAKGMTLVLDMKLHRLERIARCTGSPILSSDCLTSPKLKQCDSFRFEKFVEEHAGVSEGGKKPSKTLMFLEGCHKRLGCTILLKGTHSDELKRIKCVVQCAVVMAYHLILETSFLVDQRAMFSTIPISGLANVSANDQQSLNLSSADLSFPTVEESTEKIGSSTFDIPISNGLDQIDPHKTSLGLEFDSALSFEPYNPAIFSGLSSISASIKKVIGNRLPLASSAPYHSLSSYFGFNGKEPNGHIENALEADASNHSDEEAKSCSDEGRMSDVGHSLSLSPSNEAPMSTIKDDGNDEDQIRSKDDVNARLDSQSILVLMSSRNTLRGTMCEQSHFSHIMFYRNFDIPLGKFLQDKLLTQRSQCTVCGELPEVHFYYYAHRNKQLTIQVKRLPSNKCLPGQAEGKLWMWSRCGKCKAGSGISISTKRVLISTAARGLSFGKFLELSFCQHTLTGRTSKCGHSLDKDFLCFFGLGPMVAIFRYSSVTTYTVSLPPQKLEFSGSIRPEFFKKESEYVYTKGILLFTEVENSLKKIRSQFAGSAKGPLRDFSVVEDMLKQERFEFEVHIQNVIFKDGNQDHVYKLLSLNRLLWELLLESCIWDRRLHALLSFKPMVEHTGSADKAVMEQYKIKRDGIAGGGNGEKEIGLENCSDNTVNDANEFHIKDILIEGPAQENKDQNGLLSSSIAENIEEPVGETDKFSAQEFMKKSKSGDDDHQAKNCEVDRTIQIPADIRNSGYLHTSKGVISLPLSPSYSLDSSIKWFWMRFSEIRQMDLKELHRLYLPKFDSVSSYTPEHLPTAHQLITEEGSKLHIPLGTDNYIVTDYDSELSSLIACALAFLKDVSVPTEVSGDDSQREGRVVTKTTEGLHSLIRVPTIISTHWSSNGSLDSDIILSTPSVSSEESRFSSFDGLNLLESLIPTEPVSPEVLMGVSKSLAKGKYSVICLYANQFRELRSRCCSSELDYIASLSRCRSWDAKGGKSKSFFAKTLDDRFIIKEIKKTEFESFAKFAPHYFEYMNQSFELGNQTCLAKVFGIYQVILRQSKTGKEMRHDLMVMENLTFGRNVTRQYDLKGALHARYNTAADGAEDVLLDQNFVNDMNSSPLYVSNTAKRHLQRAVWNDTTFLNSINVMDYSLLVGVDTHGRELVCGIIDYLRQYTWDKQLETWVKSSLVVPKNLLPTVISPREYKKRFRKFMSTHFLSVPDHWCSEQSSNRCEICGIGEEDSHSKTQNQGCANGISA